MVRLSQKNKKTYNYYLALDNPQSLDNKALNRKVRREMVRYCYNSPGVGEDGPKEDGNKDDDVSYWCL